MISTIDAPATGKQVFTVKDLITAEPDPKFFDVPSDYKIVDHRKMDAGSN